MLVKAKSLNGYKLQSLDGEIGKVKEFYFDDRFWAVRYLVADTGGWLTGRQVLISPYALISANTEEQHLTVDLTKKQIEDSPPLRVTSLSRNNSRSPTTGIMDGRRIGAVHRCGGRIPTLRMILKIGKNPPKMRKRGIPIYAALTM